MLRLSLLCRLCWLCWLCWMAAGRRPPRSRVGAVVGAAVDADSAAGPPSVRGTSACALGQATGTTGGADAGRAAVPLTEEAADAAARVTFIGR
ncbi:hypothetical protein ABTZ03_34145 [Kitasatospora sp. NPDC096077]|uniref:hypothetical protein n=1 Tax=Kitasatospora sp. NPDC096077 TaxID=3155544 RepID=UPI00332956E1